MTLAGVACAQQVLVPLEPATYASRSGVCRLTVDPEDRYGNGPALYELRRRRKVIWSGKRPYTLRDAVVANDGTVAGYAYSGSQFRALVLAPDGSQRADRGVDRELSPYLHFGAYPRGRGLILDEQNNRVTVRMSDDEAGLDSETWWAFQLSTGKQLEAPDPASRMKRSEAAVLSTAAHSVAGTPLLLLHWWRAAAPDRIDSVFILVDADAKPVWRLELPGEHSTAGNRDPYFREPISPNYEPGRFDLNFVATDQRVTFGVKRKPGGGWVVEELYRQPRRLILTARPRDFPARNPRHIGAIVLRGLSDPSTGANATSTGVPSGNGLEAFEGLVVLPNGHIYAQERNSGAVHQFTRNGMRVRTYMPPAMEYGQRPGSPHFTVSREGDVIARLGARGSGRYFHLMPDGSRVEASNSEYDSSDWYLQPRSRRRWETSRHQIRLIDPARDKVIAHLRRPDRTWLGWIFGASVAPDGSLAVLDIGLEPQRRDIVRINLYTATGRPVRTLAIPENVGYVAALAFDGERVVVSSTNGVFCLDTTGTPLWRFQPPGHPPGGDVFLVGSELWLYSGGRSIERYQLPR